MSRPKTIELENGTVSLSGFPKEVSEALAEYIRAFGKEQIVILAGTDVNKHTGSTLDSFLKEEKIEISSISLDSLPHRAVGIYREGRINRVVTVAYNLDTKQALVADVKGAIDHKDATTQFKMAADKLRFV